MIEDRKKLEIEKKNQRIGEENPQQFEQKRCCVKVFTLKQKRLNCEVCMKPKASNMIHATTHEKDVYEIRN